MTLLVYAVQVSFVERPLDVTAVRDDRPSFIRGAAEIRFTIDGYATSPDDLNLLRELIHVQRGKLDILRDVSACEWCGALYPTKELRCRKGCGGPRTGARR